MKKLLCCLLCMASYTLIAQNEYKSFEIKGKVIAKSDQRPIESATVFVQRVKDSSLVSYTITNKQGEFSIEDKTTDAQLRFIIDYVGTESYSKLLDMSSEIIDLKTIILDDERNTLDEIVILADAPVRVKKDTIEFTLDFFKTRKDATVEEALKLLPGVEIDAQGNIKINGKSVSEVLVNGKPFFGDDPTIATKNLTKEIIDKVQVVDTKTKSQAFTGEEGSQQTKSINLTIKKDKNKGLFGHIRAGGGTDERYEFSGLVNYFNDNLQLGILGGANNINRSGFNSGSMFMSSGSFHVVGGVGRSVVVTNGIPFIGGGGGGISTSKNTGFNFSDNYGKNIDVSANYFYATTDNSNRSKNARENILPDRSYFTNAASETVGDNDNHKINASAEFRIDSTWLINFNPSMSFGKSKNLSDNSSNAFDENMELTNESQANSFGMGEDKSYSNDLSITKKFGRNGAYLRLNWNSRFSESDQQTFSYSIAEIYGDSPETILRDQYLLEDRKSNNHNVNIKYRQPLISKKLFFDLSLDQGYSTTKNKRSTFDNNNGEYDLFNLALSTDFNNSEQNITPRAGLTYRNEKLTLALNGGLQYQNVSNKDGLRPEFNIERDFRLPRLTTEFNYRPTKSSNYRFSYNMQNSAPSLNQLRPFENTDDPLNTIVGNPNLDFTTTHRISVNFYNYGLNNKGTFMAYGNLSLPKNQVLAKTTIDEDFVRRTEYVNINGNRSFSIGTNYNKRIKIDTIQRLNFGLNFGTSLSRNVNFNNGEKYNANNFALNPGANIYYSKGSAMFITANYSLSINQSKIDLENFENRNYLSHNFDVSSNIKFTEKLTWENGLSFNYNPEVAPGFQKSAWDWNATISYAIMKKKAFLTLKAFDILNQRTNARRIATENYIEDSQSTVLQQYFMLGFRWNFNTLGSRRNNAPPPPPPMIMRM